MARIGINFAEVAAAFEKLLTQGEQPTAEKIHALLEKGTIPVIQKHLNHIFEQSRLDLIQPDAQEPANVQNHNEPPAEINVELTSLTNDIPVAPQEVSPQEPTVSPNASVAEETTDKDRRFNRRDRFNNRHNHQNRAVELEEPIAEKPLEELSDDTLITKIRRLESILMKEQVRREVAERIMIETKDYADTIKEQVAQRINDLRQNMDEVIEQLKTQLREQKHNYDQDLKYYQEQLSKANEKLAGSLK